jgi:hypothetical protein
MFFIVKEMLEVEQAQQSRVTERTPRNQRLPVSFSVVCAPEACACGFGSGELTVN